MLFHRFLLTILKIRIFCSIKIDFSLAICYNVVYKNPPSLRETIKRKTIREIHGVKFGGPQQKIFNLMLIFIVDRRLRFGVAHRTSKTERHL